jgi:beta-galactosidase
LCVGIAGLFFLNTAQVTSAQPYHPPAGHRVDRLLENGWRFLRQDAPGAQTNAFDDSAWSVVSVPHTWNNLDGQEGGTNCYRGIGWYRTHCTVDQALPGRRFFLKFDGAFSVTDVYVNGNHLGEHQGGFAAFVFDVTRYLKSGADNVVAVKVNNAVNTNIPPLSADFTFFGGLYREVHLLVTDPVQISPLDYGSPGIYLKTTEVSSNSAKLEVTTVLANALDTAQTITLRAIVTDATTNIVTVLTNDLTIPSFTTSNAVMDTSIVRPHLWNGLADPYLYHVFVEVVAHGEVADCISQPLGFRWFSVDPDQGFFLNGHHLDLHGVSLHQDWLARGWAIGEAERRTNFVLLKEIGATAIRLSHYEHHDETYQLADQNGLVVWSEIPLVNRISESPEFYANAKQQLTELIRQRYNHPSVVCWGMFNEITMKPGPRPTALVRQLVQLAKQEDPTRPTTSAANSSDTEPSSWCTELNAFNKYFGWYNGKLEDFGPWVDTIHQRFPSRSIGISEYGAGASIRQHCEGTVAQPDAAGKFHPEEYQNLYHESHWQQMKARPFIWCKFVWNLCDFAVAARKEGDTPGRNDKGLVTYDRQVRKDAFYWYKANWTTNPMVYITGHTFTNRMTNEIMAKVYANCDSVELFLNGASQGIATSTNCIFTWPVTLAAGTNAVRAVGNMGSVQTSDSLVWSAPVSPSPAKAARPMTSARLDQERNAEKN